MKEERIIKNLNLSKTENYKTTEDNILNCKMDTVKIFSQGLTHELNNLLTGISSTVSVMRNKLNKDGFIEKEKLEKYIEVISGCKDRTSEIIENLSILSQKKAFNYKVTDINKIINNVIKTCKNDFDQTIIIKSIIYKEPAIIFADYNAIEKVIWELCLNASKILDLKKEKNRNKEITITLEKEGEIKNLKRFRTAEKDLNYWKISIKDTGIGISPDIASKMFDPFFSDGGNSKGLGLSISYNIIKQHKGFMDVRYKEGSGTTFSVYLPLHK